MSLFNPLSIGEKQAPIMVYFDHLASEYDTLEPKVEDAQDKSTVETLKKKREEKKLSWNDLYTFELILAQHRPPEQLRSKVIQLRNHYRSVAGQQEYDEYMASKPPDLAEPPDPDNPRDATKAELERLLREDMKDLLGRLFLLYEILPIREAELRILTWRAAKICLGAMVLLFIIVTVMFMVDSDITNWKEWRIPSLTVFVVVIAGAMGGFVSALQRIQRPPSGGDSFYNLAKLYYASYSVFIAPITGGIFAILLYLMFTAGILKGSFFPNIYTPAGAYENTSVLRPTTSPTPATSSTPRAVLPFPVAEPPAPGAPGPGQQDRAGRQSNRASSPNTANNTNDADAGNTTSVVTTGNANSATADQPSSNTNSNAGGNTNGNANQRQAGSASNTNSGATQQSSPTPTPSPTPAPTPVLVATRSIGVKAFLAESGPAAGVDYAMLIIWCFIAGFAERFVPDALDRMIPRGSSGNKP